MHLPLLEGEIDSLKEYNVSSPPDYAWAAIRLALVVAILPAGLSLFAGLGAMVVIILLLGGGMLLMVFGAIAGVFGKFLTLLLPRGRSPDHDTIQVSMVVKGSSGDEHEVILYGDRAGGRLRKGDIVEVYGRHMRDGDIRASRIVVVGAAFAAGNIARRTVRGVMPLPGAVAILAWIGAAVVWGMVYFPFVLPLIQRQAYP